MMSSSTYDFFLSFRGDDTGSGFVGNLYNALRDNGIRTFMDEKELHKENQIKTSLLKGIQDSKIAIVVLSENYASSSFCLDELVDILDYSNNNEDALVLPVFYKVDPSDVRHERSNYGEALAKHEKENTVSMERLIKWKKALKEVANLSGFHFGHGAEYEYKFIQNIVEMVSSKINRALSHVADFPVGLEFLDGIVHLLKPNMSKFQVDMTVKLKHQQTNELKIIPVELQLRKHCHFGEQFFIVGDDPMLGSWNPSDALPMTWSEGDVWTAHLDIPAGKSIQYKLIMKGGTNNIDWQPGPNRTLQPRENMIRATICEDWENAESQKLIPEFKHA